MNPLAALCQAIRTILLLAVVGILAFGSLAAPLAAAQSGLSAASVILDDISEIREQNEVDEVSGKSCPSGHSDRSHDNAGGACCVGICSGVILADTITAFPATGLTSIEPSHLSLSARSRIVEFLRPPSLTI